MVGASRRFSNLPTNGNLSTRACSVEFLRGLIEEAVIQRIGQTEVASEKYQFFVEVELAFGLMREAEGIPSTYSSTLRLELQWVNYNFKDNHNVGITL